MAGLMRICKMYGSMVVNGTKWVWDYAQDKPVKENEMKMGSEAWKASERAKYSVTTAMIKGQGDQP